jgi:PilZ domain-containing protein
MQDADARHRRHPRYVADLEVIIYRPGDAIRARVTMISRGGCLIFPALADPTSSPIKMSFRLADELPYINCKGQVVYSINDRGTGVAFTEISQYNQDLITDYFERRLATEKQPNS